MRGRPRQTACVRWHSLAFAALDPGWVLATHAARSSGGSGGSSSPSGTAAAMPAAKGGADAGEEEGLSEAQLRARNAARKYRESQDRDMARKRRSGSVWMVVALINAVRHVCPSLSFTPLPRRQRRFGRGRDVVLAAGGGHRFLLCRRSTH